MENNFSLRGHVPPTKSSGTNKMIMRKQIKLELYLRRYHFQMTRVLHGIVPRTRSKTKQDILKWNISPKLS